MLSVPVRAYMTRDPLTVAADATLEAVAAELSSRQISAVPVVDALGVAVGVVSRRDLLRIGQLHFPPGRALPQWRLPEAKAQDVMSGPVVAVAPTASVGEASSQMVERRLHRVFVEADGRLSGVLTTRDVMKAIADERLEQPISTYMSNPAQTIASTDPLHTGRRQLEELGIRGLVVMDQDVPVGLFTEEDALAARERPADTRVEEVMGHAFIVMRPETPAHRAAAQMSSMHVQRIVVMADGDLVGVLTGFDLAGAAALSELT